MCRNRKTASLRTRRLEELALARRRPLRISPLNKELKHEYFCLTIATRGAITWGYRPSIAISVALTGFIAICAVPNLFHCGQRLFHVLYKSTA